MAEFDTTGFSAVEDFFGSTSELNDGDKEAQKPQKYMIPSAGKRRGVGTAVTTRDHNLADKLMKVGRKRRRYDGNDDEEDYGMENSNKDGYDDEEEDVGRTGIAPLGRVERSDLAINENKPSSGTKKVARKLGKKERQRLKAQGQSPEGDDQRVTTTSEIKLVENSSSPGKVDQKRDEEVPSFKKPKRRKVRSKQKNIRKDNREKKPDHLVVGRKHYQGRPLTTETRAKLNLPPPTPRAPFILNSTSKAAGQEDVAGLAIESLLGDSGMGIGSTQNPAQPKLKRSKKRKSKYKNLK